MIGSKTIFQLGPLASGQTRMHFIEENVFEEQLLIFICFRQCKEYWPTLLHHAGNVDNENIRERLFQTCTIKPSRPQMHTDVVC